MGIAGKRGRARGGNGKKGKYDPLIAIVKTRKKKKKSLHSERRRKDGRAGGRRVPSQ